MNKGISKKKEIKEAIDLLYQIKFEPTEINDFLLKNFSAQITQKTKASQILLRPGIDLHNMVDSVPVIKNTIGHFSKEALEQAEIQIKY